MKSSHTIRGTFTVSGIGRSPPLSGLLLLNHTRLTNSVKSSAPFLESLCVRPRIWSDRCLWLMVSAASGENYYPYGYTFSAFHPNG